MALRSRFIERLVRPFNRSEAEPVGGRRPDVLAVEEPLAIELDGVRVATTMRTPGHDFELAVGFCTAEGLLGAAGVTSVRYCGTGSAAETEFNVVSVSTGGMAPPPVPRLTMTTSSCGFCGTAQIDGLAQLLDPVGGPLLEWAVLADAPKGLIPHQKLFAQTGAVHAAGIVTPDGVIDLVREDVGRHNAVDKVVGRLALDGLLPADGLGLVLSGRASFELIHKAWAAGFRAVVAVGAPTALAVTTAERAGLQLAGFARDGRLTIHLDGR